MTTDINTIMLESARAQVATLERGVQGAPDNTYLKQLLDTQRGVVANLERQMGISVRIEPAAAPAPAGPSLEDRIAALEVRMQPEVDAAARAGMALMQSIGNGLSPEQAQFVQEKLATSPDFFASQQCRTVLELFISEWQTFEGAKS